MTVHRISIDRSFSFIQMCDLNETRKKCHTCIDDFMNRSDICEDYKKKRVGQAIAYMNAARKTYSNESNQGYQGEYIKDDLGRCHAEENSNGYFAGQFVPCPAQGNQGGSRGRTGQSRQSRERVGCGC